MTMKKFKIWCYSLGVFFFLCLIGWVMTPNSVKQSIYDTKADLVGTHRIARIYSPETATLVETYEDDAMRFEVVGERGMRIWLGDAKKKVFALNMGVTVEDQ